jgi:hypothetical protein
MGAVPEREEFTTETPYVGRRTFVRTFASMHLGCVSMSLALEYRLVHNWAELSGNAHRLSTKYKDFGYVSEVFVFLFRRISPS